MDYRVHEGHFRMELAAAGLHGHLVWVLGGLSLLGFPLLEFLVLLVLVIGIGGFGTGGLVGLPLAPWIGAGILPGVLSWPSWLGGLVHMGGAERACLKGLVAGVAPVVFPSVAIATRSTALLAFVWLIVPGHCGRV